MPGKHEIFSFSCLAYMKFAYITKVFMQFKLFFSVQILDALAYIEWRGRVYLNLEPANVLVCSGRSLGKTIQVKLANLETCQTVAKQGTAIKGTYNFDYTGDIFMSLL